MEHSKRIRKKAILLQVALWGPLLPMENLWNEMLAGLSLAYQGALSLGAEQELALCEAAKLPSWKLLKRPLQGHI